MTSNPYTPDETELIGTWVDAHRSEAWGGRADKSGEVRERSAEARRGIAKIKADARIAAWKEVAEFMRTQTSDDVTVLRAAHLAATTIYYRASQIEQEET